MFRHILVIFCALSVLLSSSAVVAKEKRKKPREKDHPNYERYLADEEFRSGRSSRLAGILTASIGGGVGGGILIVGMLWNSCLGAGDDQLSRCKTNARNTMVAGGVVTAASLGTGIPLIVIGGEKMGQARRRIDQEFPVKSEAEKKPPEEAKTFAHPAEGLSLAVRVLNLEF